jgi:hypothetical protein
MNTPGSFWTCYDNPICQSRLGATNGPGHWLTPRDILLTAARALVSAGLKEMDSTADTSSLLSLVKNVLVRLKELRTEATDLTTAAKAVSS